MIIEYDIKYDDDIKDLLVELQEHIVAIDKEKYNIINKEFREEYLKSNGCKDILLGVFCYNDSAIKFYSKFGYHTRMLDMTKKSIRL